MIVIGVCRWFGSSDDWVKNK